MRSLEIVIILSSAYITCESLPQMRPIDPDRIIYQDEYAQTLTERSNHQRVFAFSQAKQPRQTSPEKNVFQFSNILLALIQESREKQRSLLNTTHITTTQAPKTRMFNQAFYSCYSNCATTSEYNPICGSDGRPYHNSQKLYCTNECGHQMISNWTHIRVVHSGVCVSVLAWQLKPSPQL